MVRKLARVVKFSEPEPFLNLDGLSFEAVKDMTEAEALDEFIRRRWPGGVPVCPKCGDAGPYTLMSRGKVSRFKCRDCYHQYSALSGTVFDRSKLPPNVLIKVIAYTGPGYQFEGVAAKSVYSIRNKVGINNARRREDAP